ncbi:MAG: phosphate acyltransferase, partial [Alphaproteobacteria bacterium]|nr:phosphate acyltransferase [Alphaproteobacteria bacterium]
MSITLAVDAMGGDGAPDIVIKGIALTLKHHLGINVMLYGDSERLVTLLTSEGLL